MRTMQEAHEFIKAHLIKQGGQARKSDGNCAYLASGGQRCAVGCLLDPATASEWDEAGDTSIQNIVEGIGGNKVIDKVKIVGSTPVIIDFLIHWQNVHDGSEHVTIDKWEGYIERHANHIADRFSIGNHSDE